MIAHIPLGPIPNTFGLDARAATLIEYDGADDLRTLYDEGLLHHPFLHVGAGSNLLFTRPYPGTVLHNRDTRAYVLWDDEATVGIRISAGHRWDDLVAYAVEHGWHGLENLSGIPGEVGSAAVQNIGAYGVEVADRITEVTVFDTHTGRTTMIPVERMQYGYRDSLLKHPEQRHLIVTHVTMALDKIPSLNTSYRALAQSLSHLPHPTLADVRDAVIALRNSKLPDPARHGNAGSFFKNPVVTPTQYAHLLHHYPDMPAHDTPDGMKKLSAAWLIDRAGWKGHRHGNASVWHLQPLVLVNDGAAEGAEIAALAHDITADIHDKYGITLTPEVCIL